MKSLPSKLVSHHIPKGVSTIIARSDSNGEDLEGFAGAGLYDSVTVKPPKSRAVNYADEWIVWDAKRRQELMAKLAELAVAIEVEMKAPQTSRGASSEATSRPAEPQPGDVTDGGGARRRPRLVAVRRIHGMVYMNNKE